jgi:hypothetical protein
LATDGTVPTFGLWYDFRQKPPLGDYAGLYAECLEESERLGYEGSAGGSRIYRSSRARSGGPSATR